ncbi:MAG: HAD family hydrolase [Anaerolineae bacterium]|nr:HAD family hydrolase [Anaerolineae bacterium]
MIVISDMIGTVTTGSPVIGLVKWVRLHQSAARANFYIGWNLPGYILARWGVVNWLKWAQGFMISALPLLKHPSQKMLNGMAEWSVEHELWPKRRQDVLDQLSGHIEQGAQVHIASSVYEPTVQAFARRIGAQGIGTPLQIVNGRVSFREQLAADRHKAEKVLSRLGVNSVAVAYGDTWADIHLLGIAERPVAVYPDDVLKAIALERGWEILGERNAE